MRGKTPIVTGIVQLFDEPNLNFKCSCQVLRHVDTALIDT